MGKRNSQEDCRIPYKRADVSKKHRNRTHRNVSARVSRPRDNAVEIRGQNLFKDDGIELPQHVGFLRAAPGNEGGGSPIFADVVVRTGIDPGQVFDAVGRRIVQSVELQRDKVKVEAVGGDGLEDDRRTKFSLNIFPV